MADEPQVAAGEGALTGFEGYSTAALERIRANLERGMVDAHRHMEAGTLNDRPKPGSATPREAGYTIDVLARQIDRVLKTRKERAGIVTEIVKGLWYPQGPPPLEGESDIEYTNRLLGAGPRGQEGRPYDHRRNRQCSIGYHQECSDKLHLGVTMPDAGCGCPCHIERLHAYARVKDWNECFPVGSWVAFPEGSNEPNEQTTSQAYVDEVGWPVVKVKTFNHPLWLSWLEPVRQL